MLMNFCNILRFNEQSSSTVNRYHNTCSNNLVHSVCIKNQLNYQSGRFEDLIMVQTQKKKCQYILRKVCKYFLTKHSPLLENLSNHGN